MVEKIKKSDEEWENKLTPEQYRIMRQKETEAPFSDKYYFLSEADGVYKCSACGNPLFSSDAKFDSGTGWPSFTEPLSKGSVEYAEDKSHGMARTEVMCKKCGGHLGHIFDDGPKERGGKRYCINSICLDKIDNEESPKY
ncbi:MAG: peptide-methionine (R)-S-oxide reductase MsrB [Candidatus Spechtbacterales bacterium]